MSGYRLVIMARYWNDMDWLEASLKHIEEWEADEIYISEGNWDKKFPARSTDGTYEYLSEWVGRHGNANLIKNLRDNDNYRINQAETSNLVMQMADVKPGDWVMVIDCDHFYFKDDIQVIKSEMKEGGFDYLSYGCFNFITGIGSYYERWDRNGSKLPYRFLSGASWIPTNHLAMNNRMYCDCPNVIEKKTDVKAYHYAVMRPEERLTDKYNIGDRQHPVKWNNGKMLEDLKLYTGKHPVLAEPVLKRKGIIDE